MSYTAGLRSDCRRIGFKSDSFFKPIFRAWVLAGSLSAAVHIQLVLVLWYRHGCCERECSISIGTDTRLYLEREHFSLCPPHNLETWRRPSIVVVLLLPLHCGRMPATSDGFSSSNQCVPEVARTASWHSGFVKVSLTFLPVSSCFRNAVV